MNDRKQNLLSIVGIIASLIRTIQLRRTFHAVSPKPPLVFWRVIYHRRSRAGVVQALWFG